LLSSQRRVEQTAYAYDSAAQRTRSTLPDGSTLAYAYDGAHRLTQVEDGIGNRIVYTLDAIGNRVREDAYDPGWRPVPHPQPQYDALTVSPGADLGGAGAGDCLRLRRQRHG